MFGKDEDGGGLDVEIWTCPVYLDKGVETGHTQDESDEFLLLGVGDGGQGKPKKTLVRLIERDREIHGESLVGIRRREHCSKVTVDDGFCEFRGRVDFERSRELVIPSPCE